MSLDRVTQAAAAAARAQTELRAAVLAAVDAGEEVASVAREAGVARPTVYRWINAEGSSTVDVREALDEALHVLAALGAHRAATEGLNASDVLAKARRADLAARNLPPSAWENAGIPRHGEEETTVSTGLAVAAALLADPSRAARKTMRLPV